MRGTKKLYEANQIMEQRIRLLESKIEYYQSSSYIDTQASKINPAIVNTAEYKMVLLAKDMIEATNRYITDIPALNLPTNRLEMLFYIYGSLCLFRFNGEPRVGSYAKTGSLNGIGDLSEIIPIDFAGHSYKTVYNVVYNKNVKSNAAVIVNDYTGTYREDNIIPRAALNSVSISDQALVYKRMRNSILVTAKKAIAFVENETQRAAIEESINAFLTNDSPVGSVVADSMEAIMKVFNLDTALDIDPYIKAIDNYERIRANFNGIFTQPVIDKKERAIAAETNNADTVTEIMLYDGLINRKIGFELAQKHAIIDDYTVEINPKLLQRKMIQNNESGEGKTENNSGNKSVKGGGK